MDAQDALAHDRDAMTVKQVFGDPYEKDGATLVRWPGCEAALVGEAAKARRVKGRALVGEAARAAG